MSHIQLPHAPEDLAAPVLEFDLGAEINRLHEHPDWRTGQNAMTLVKYDDFRVVLTVLAAGRRIPEHQTEGRISIHVVTGRIRLRLGSRTVELPAGRVLALDRGIRHDVEAIEESAFLLSIAWPGASKSSV